MYNCIFEHFMRWQNVLMFGVVLCFILIQFSPPFNENLSLVYVSVTDGKVNGTLSLGTYGYCLHLPNKNCSEAHFQYEIRQFFPNHRIL